MSSDKIQSLVQVRTFKFVIYGIDCLTRPIQSSIVSGGVFSAIDAMMGRPITLNSIGSYIGFIYAYNAIQCPMELIHGRQSSLHNFIAGGTLGYLGVTSGRLGIPFIDPYTLYRYPMISPGTVAFGVYGGMGMALATLGGKRI